MKKQESPGFNRGEQVNSADLLASACRQHPTVPGALCRARRGHGRCWRDVVIATLARCLREIIEPLRTVDDSVHGLHRLAGVRRDGRAWRLTYGDDLEGVLYDWEIDQLVPATGAPFLDTRDGRVVLGLPRT